MPTLMPTPTQDIEFLSPKEPKETIWTNKASFLIGNKSPKGIEILDAISKLIKSKGKDIDPALVRGFNQHGRWTFVDKLEGLHPSLEAQVFMANFKLPEEKRTMTDPNGHVHLLTNYIDSEEKETHNIPYASINGCLIIKNSFYIKAEILTKVNGRAQFERAKKIETPNLKEVNGDLFARMAVYIKAPKLTTVNGTLDIFYAKGTELNALRNLKAIKFSHLSIGDQTKLIKNLSLSSLAELNNPEYTKKFAYTDHTLSIIEKEIKSKELKRAIMAMDKTKPLEL